MLHFVKSQLLALDQVSLPPCKRLYRLWIWCLVTGHPRVPPALPPSMEFLLASPRLASGRCAPPQCSVGAIAPAQAQGTASSTPRPQASVLLISSLGRRGAPVASAWCLLPIVSLQQTDLQVRQALDGEPSAPLCREAGKRPDA